VSSNHGRRALLGNLDPVTCLGMARVLEEGGLQVVGNASQPEALVDEARRLQPDSVVIGFDGEASSELGARVRTAAPGATVILWARDETEMRVFDPGSSRARRVASSAPAALLHELGTGRARERT
jgi:DNA-binding NarL/FixJ family response regulator